MAMFMHLTITGIILPLLLPQNRRHLNTINRPRNRRIIMVVPWIIAGIISYITYAAGALGLSSGNVLDYCFVAAGDAFYGMLDFYAWLTIFIIVTLGGVCYTLYEGTRSQRRFKKLCNEVMKEAAEKEGSTMPPPVPPKNNPNVMPTRFKRMFLLPVCSAITWMPPYIR
ncbi:hypothetical protein KIPB_011596, partial [Kipferlia bialata]|eukprot:g11596.t1